MKKIYGTYRRISKDGQAGLYGPAEALNKQYQDYFLAGLTSVNDTPIENINYTGEVAPGVLKQSRLIIGEYNEDYINEIDFKNNIKNVGATYQIEMFDDIEEVKQWIRDNTNLIEIEDGKFENGSYQEPITEEQEREITKIEYTQEGEAIETKETIIENITIDYITKPIYLIIE